MGNAFTYSILPLLLMPGFLSIAKLIELRNPSSFGVKIFLVMSYISGAVGVLLCYFLFGGSPLFGGDYYSSYF